MKKLLALLLAAAMVLALVPMTAMAAPTVIDFSSIPSLPSDMSDVSIPVEIKGDVTLTGTTDWSLELIVDATGDVTVTLKDVTCTGSVMIQATDKCDLTLNLVGTNQFGSDIADGGMASLTSVTITGDGSLFCLGRGGGIGVVGDLIIKSGTVMAYGVHSAVTNGVGVFCNNNGEVKMSGGSLMAEGALAYVVGDADGNMAYGKLTALDGATLTLTAGEESVTNGPVTEYKGERFLKVVATPATPILEETPIPETGDGLEIFLFAGLALLSMLGMVVLKKRAY